MSVPFKTLSGYRLMWVWALFDLPVTTPENRKLATQFRLELLDLGFEMVQYSVYIRHCPSMERADYIADYIGQNVPEDGKVDILFFTDKQFGMTKSYRGEGQSAAPKKPQQLLMF